MLVSHVSKKVVVIVVPVVLVLLLASYAMYSNGQKYVVTEDAFFNGPMVTLASEVPGKISKVSVKVHSSVKKGDLLAKLDDSNYREILVAAENEASALKAIVELAEKTFSRVSNLRKNGVVSLEQYDQARAEYLELNRRLKAANSEVARVRLALAQTEIKAPEDGIIAKCSAQPGALVAPGVPMFAYVLNSERWVEAAFKETDLSEIRQGMPVEIKFVSYPSKILHGKLTSIGPATGSAFSLLPANNATGNFTPVIQRVPARVLIEDLKPGDIENLAVGLSVSVKVRLAQ